MSSIIRIKRSSTSGNPATLAAGELAYSALPSNGVNGGDILYFGFGTETGGNAANHYAIGGKYFTDMLYAATDANTASTIVRRDASGNFTAGTITATLAGNAASATKLATARTINGVSFDGTANITVTAASPNALTIGTGLTGTSYNGSSAVTIAIDSTVALRADTHYIGTTAVALNRASANLALTGITSVTFPGSTSGTVQLIPAAAVGTGTVLTIPATTGTIITTGDTGTVTNTMLAGSIANAKLTNSAVTVGTTSISLGAAATTIAGLVSVTSTSFVGALTGNASTATALATGRTISITGDIAYTSGAFDGTNAVTGTGTLATVNTNVGSFGSSTSIPVITVNGKGLVTAVSTATISTSLSVAGGTGTGTIALGTDTFTIGNGTGVTSTYNNTTKTFTLAIGQAVATTSNVTFNDVTVNGTLYSNDITAASLTLAGDATITGNLTVQGTTTTINSTTIAVSDLNITVAKDAATAVAANGAGLTVNGPTTPATILYASTDDSWNFNKKVNAPSGIVGALTGNASTATTLATGRTISITGDISYTSPSFNGSGNVTAAGTLATVNSNVGSFGSSTSVATFTVNAKGLVTAAGTAAIPTATTSVLGLASFDTTNFLVTAGAVSITAVDGGTY